MRRLIRKTHKWVAVAASLFLLSWLVSGFVMAIPYQWLARMVGLTPMTAAAPGGNATDYRDITITVPEAIAALEAERGDPIEVRSIRFSLYEDRLVYDIFTGDGSARLVDATTGEPVVPTAAWAERLAREVVRQPGRIKETVVIAQRDYHYWGTTPAYKITFDDPPGYIVYVSENAVVTRTSRMSRLYRWVTSFHEFEPLRLIYNSNRFRVVAMVLFSALSILVAASGLYLALPARRRSRPVAVQET